MQRKPAEVSEKVARDLRGGVTADGKWLFDSSLFCGVYAGRYTSRESAWILQDSSLWMIKTREGSINSSANLEKVMKDSHPYILWRNCSKKNPSTFFITEKNLEISGQIMLTWQLLQPIMPFCPQVLKSYCYISSDIIMHKKIWIWRIMDNYLLFWEGSET